MRLATTTFLFFVCLSVILHATEEYAFVATGEEIRGYDNHVKAADDFWNKFNANFGSIRTWQGHVGVVKKTWQSRDRKEPRYHLEYDVDFHSDLVNVRDRCVSTATLGVFWQDGERRPFLLSREAVICRKELTPGFTYTAYTSHHYMDEVPKEERSEYVSTLAISTNDDDLNMFFYPEKQSLPFSGLPAIKSIFDIFDLDKLERKYEERGLTEDRVKELLAPIRENGFPEHWKLSKKDHFLYFDDSAGAHHTWDLSRGGWPIFFKSGTHRWHCELQQVSGIWIPQKITIEYESDDGSYSTEEMTWTDQKINEPIDENLWTVASLGVRRGDQGYDARTEETFKVEGDEYLPSLEQEAIEALLNKPKKRWTFLRIAAVTGGFFMIIAACYMMYRGRVYREKTQ